VELGELARECVAVAEFDGNGVCVLDLVRVFVGARERDDVPVLEGLGTNEFERLAFRLGVADTEREGEGVIVWLLLVDLVALLVLELVAVWLAVLDGVGDLLFVLDADAGEREGDRLGDRDTLTASILAKVV
jgi:hypothetical protein